jgi:hypothetical protein
VTEARRRSHQDRSRPQPGRAAPDPAEWPGAVTEACSRSGRSQPRPVPGGTVPNRAVGRGGGGGGVGRRGRVGVAEGSRRRPPARLRRELGLRAQTPPESAAASSGLSPRDTQIRAPICASYQTQPGLHSRGAVTQRAQLATSIDGNCTCLSHVGCYMSWQRLPRQEQSMRSVWGGKHVPPPNIRPQ